MIARSWRPRADRMLLALLAGSALSLLAPEPARAAATGPQQQEIGQQEIGQQEIGQADAVGRFDIPAQPLPQALIRFSQVAGIELFFDASLAEGARSAPLSGSYATRDALALMLTGTGLTFRFTNPTTVTLERLPPAGGVMLEPLQVEAGRAAAANSYGPVPGYVAPVSAGGTKTDTPLLETPQSISVVTSNEMAARNARNFADALGYTSGVRAGTLGASNGFGGDSISIRGFGGNGTSGTSFNEYIDGMRLGGTGYLVSGLDPYLFERVEVIKGPASVLYGQATPGGLMNMVSKRPTPEPRHEVQFQTGSLGRLQGSFDYSDLIDREGEFSYRVAGIAYRTDAETDNSDDKRRVAIAPSFTWRPTIDTSVTLLTGYQNDDFGGSTLNWLPAAGTVLPNPNGRISRDLFTGDPNYEKWRRETLNLGYVVDHRFNDVFSARQHFRYTHNKLDYAGLYVSTLAADLRTANRQAFGMVEHSDDYTLDNQLQAKLDTGPVRHTVLLGADGQQFQNDTDRVLQAVAPTLDIYDPSYGVSLNLSPFRKQESRGSQYGLYLQDQIAFGGLRLLLGLRQDWARSTTRDLINGTSISQKDDALTKRAGVMYLFDSGIAPYFSYAESFEPQVGAVVKGGGQAEPTEGEQVEVGVKYQPPGYDSFVTASLFDLRRTNVLTPDPDNPAQSVQTGEVRSRGFELEGKASLGFGLNATAAYTYLDAETTKSTGTVMVNGVPVPLEGKTPTRIPAHSASLWLDYTFAKGGLRGLGLGGGVRYVGSTYGNDANTFKVPSFTLFDAMLRYDLAGLDAKLQGVELQLNATNLFDKEYVSTCFGDYRCYYGSGRMVFASLKYSW